MPGKGRARAVSCNLRTQKGKCCSSRQHQDHNYFNCANFYSYHRNKDCSWLIFSYLVCITYFRCYYLLLVLVSLFYFFLLTSQCSLRNEILLGCTDLKRNRDRHGHSALRTISCHCEQEVCTHCTRGCRCMDNTKQCMWCSDALLHCLDAATLQASRVHDRSQSLLQALISCRRPWATKQTQ